MKKLLFFLMLAVALLPIAQAQSEYDFVINSRTDTSLHMQQIDNFDADLYFLKDTTDTTKVTLVRCIGPGYSISSTSSTSIGDHVTLPSVVTKVWSRGDGPEGVVISSDYTITKLAKSAFRGTGCRYLSIPSSVTSIGDSACYYMGNLDTIVLPEHLGYCGRDAFNECLSLSASMFTGSLEQWCNIDFVDDESSPIFFSKNLYISDTIITHLDLPEGLLSLKPHLFAYDSMIVDVIFPKSMDSIGASTFKQCFRLDSVYIPSRVRYIGNRCFDNCFRLRSVTFNAKRCYYAGAAGQTLFAGCRSIQNIYIGDSVEIIPPYMFMYCNHIDHVDIPNSVTEIGECAFNLCSSIQGKVVIPEGLQLLGERSFSNCQLIDTIEYNATCAVSRGGLNDPPFEYDSLARVIIIGKNVEVIPNHCFRTMTGVEHIISKSSEPPYVPSLDAFADIDKYATLVSIPCGSIDAYQTEYGWQDFQHWDAGVPFDFDITSAEPELGSAAILHRPTCTILRGQIQAIPNSNARFVSWSDGDTNALRLVDVVGDTAIAAHFEAATEGIRTLEGIWVDIYSQNDEVVVTNAEGQQVMIYDMMGRQIVNERGCSYGRYRMPASGVYVVRIGMAGAQKVVVRR